MTSQPSACNSAPEPNAETRPTEKISMLLAAWAWPAPRDDNVYQLGPQLLEYMPPQTGRVLRHLPFFHDVDNAVSDSTGQWVPTEGRPMATRREQLGRISPCQAPSWFLGWRASPDFLASEVTKRS